MTFSKDLGSCLWQSITTPSAQPHPGNNFQRCFIHASSSLLKVNLSFLCSYFKPYRTSYTHKSEKGHTRIKLINHWKYLECMTIFFPRATNMTQANALMSSNKNDNWKIYHPSMSFWCFSGKGLTLKTKSQERSFSSLSPNVALSGEGNSNSHVWTQTQFYFFLPVLNYSKETSCHAFSLPFFSCMEIFSHWAKNIAPMNVLMSSCRITAIYIRITIFLILQWLFYSSRGLWPLFAEKDWANRN